MSDKTLTPEQAEFQDFCRAWLQENKPAPHPTPLPQAAYEVTDPSHLTYLTEWQAKCYEAGLIASDLPKQYGGHGMTDCQQIASNEVRSAGVPYFINWIGLGMAVPTLLECGTEAQKETFLPPIFSAEHIWCQGFSEPGAGSDLASLQASAVKEGDQWIINGSKVWTSLGHFAQYMLLLARQDKNDKYGGITYFLAPMDQPGITVKPIHKMTGESGFNEVFLDNAIERGAGVGVGAVVGESPMAVMQQVIQLAKDTRRNGQRVWDDPVWRDRIVKVYERTEASLYNGRRARVKALNGGAMRIPLQGKLTGSEISQSLHQIALGILGLKSSLYVGDEHAPANGKWPLGYMNTYTGTISGGSSEIQRNILGERVLGLAKSK
jgi:alkylation response protein AidB-like acyl-CoA dehydrogenase